MKISKTFTALAALVLLLTSLPVHAADEYQKKRDEIVTLVNEQRAAQGIPELYEAVELNQVAQIRAEEIVNDFSHVRPNGERGYTIVGDAGIECFFVAENLGFGSASEEDIVNLWMSSEGHRNNILNEIYQTMGVGVVVTDSGVYWVQMFTDNGELTPVYTTGDVNGDQSIDAQDAAQVLIDSAEVGSGKSGILSRMQRSYADVNDDGRTDAQDAACILSYATYVGAGGTDSIEVYLTKD